MSSWHRNFYRQVTRGLIGITRIVAGMPRWVLRIMLGLTAVVIGTVLFTLVIGCTSLSGPRYAGPESDHFDGKRFVNQKPGAHGGFGDFIRWMWTRNSGPWDNWTDSSPTLPPPPRVTDGRLRVTFVNHATVLIQMDGLNILTDPIWSDRASPFAWIGPHRVRSPGIRFEDLPPIDAVIISHNHYDHLDLPTLVRLENRFHPRFFLGLGNAALLRSSDISQLEELDWWQSFTLAPGLQITSVPAQHFSARGLCDRDATLWTGYVIQGKSGTVYFAGDTGYGPHFRQIRERFGQLRLALLPIGAFRPQWFMSRVHISPREAVRAHQALGASTSMAIHFGTFRLGDDGQYEPAQELALELRKSTVPANRFWVLDFGEGREVPPVTEVQAKKTAASWKP